MFAGDNTKLGEKGGGDGVGCVLPGHSCFLGNNAIRLGLGFGFAGFALRAWLVGFAGFAGFAFFACSLTAWVGEGMQFTQTIFG